VLVCVGGVVCRVPIRLSTWQIGNRNRLVNLAGKKTAIEIEPSIWREEIGKIEPSIWREEIGNRNRTVNLAGRNRQ
jgi:hypothetical protein